MSRWPRVPKPSPHACTGEVGGGAVGDWGWDLARQYRVSDLWAELEQSSNAYGQMVLPRFEVRYRLGGHIGHRSLRRFRNVVILSLSRSSNLFRKAGGHKLVLRVQHQEFE